MYNRLFSIIYTMFLLGLISILSVDATSHAATPVVSKVTGGISDGSTITITGSGFGPTGPNVILFDDFSRGVDGQVLSTNATVGNWSSMKMYSYADKLLSAGKGARAVPPGTPASYWQGTKLFGGTYSEVFMSSGGYIPASYRWPSATDVHQYPPLSSLKHQWIYYDIDGYASNDKPDIFTPNRTSADFYRVTSNDRNVRGSFDTADGISWAWDEPMRFSIWIKGNGTSAVGSDGLFQSVSSTGQLFERYKDYKAWFTSTDVALGFDRMSVPGYLRLDTGTPGFPTSNYVIDDVYVAVGPNAAARIEIGNNPVYTSCTKLAISTPTSWSDSSITATVRKGTMITGNAYLFVIDANQNVSNAYPVTLTSAGTIIAPTGLRVSATTK